MRTLKRSCEGATVCADGVKTITHALQNDRATKRNVNFLLAATVRNVYRETLLNSALPYLVIT